jgi:hypothetical protein
MRKDRKMQFKQYGHHLLNPKVTIGSQRLIEAIFLRRLNYLLGFVADRQPEILSAFISDLAGRLNSQVAETPTAEMPFSIAEFPYLQDQSELVNLHWRFCLQTLALPVDQVVPNADLEITCRAFYRIILIPRYYYLETLAGLLGKSVGVELFKTYLDEYLVSIRDEITKDKDLDEMRSRQLRDDLDRPENGWLVTISNVEDGKVVWRHDNCLFVEALDDFDNKDFVYLVCCYSDFQAARMQNENFELTRLLTIAMGDPICDKVFHDKRIVPEVIHPPKEFWDQIVVEES